MYKYELVGENIYWENDKVQTGKEGIKIKRDFMNRFKYIIN